MKIPNIDGIYETRDGNIHVTVTRSEIVITVMQKTKDRAVHIIDDDMHQNNRSEQYGGEDNLSKKFHKAGKQLTALSDMIMGDGKH